MAKLASSRDSLLEKKKYKNFHMAQSLVYHKKCIQFNLTQFSLPLSSR